MSVFYILFVKHLNSGDFGTGLAYFCTNEEPKTNRDSYLLPADNIAGHGAACGY